MNTSDAMGGWKPDSGEGKGAARGVPRALLDSYGTTHIVGEVRQLDERKEDRRDFYMDKVRQQVTVRSFRVLERLENGDERMHAVEMRGRFFSGNIQNGDIVAFPRQYVEPGRTCELDSICNLSAGNVLVQATNSYAQRPSPRTGPLGRFYRGVFRFIVVAVLASLGLLTFTRLRPEHVVPGAVGAVLAASSVWLLICLVSALRQRRRSQADTA